jgi:hypothetical protein
MKNPTISLLRYWSRCQQGLPVYFAANAGGGHSLSLGPTAKASATGPRVYARLDRPTERLLLHFVRTGAPSNCVLLRGDVLHLPEGSTISSQLARQLFLPADHYHLRPGKYPLLSDQRFLTASVEIIERQLPDTLFPSHQHPLAGHSRQR